MKANSHNIDWRVPEVFNPLLKDGLRYLGAWGGRGGAKSHFFAGYCVIQMLDGKNVLCVREIQKSIGESVKRLIEAKLKEFDVERFFTVTENSIRCNYNGAICIFRGLQSHTADSVKSLEGFDICWVEEAQSLSDRSLTLLIPTIRKENSRLLFSWNPMRPTDPIDMLLRGSNTPTNSVVVRSNWSDNPWFPDVLEQERKDCLENQPDRYGHIWEGEYATVLEGAYFAKHLTQAQLDRRIGRVARDPIMKTYAFFDIGGTSTRSDATAIWIGQFVGSEVRVLDYYEAVGQPFEAHVNWLRANDYEDVICVLPHDGRKHDSVYQVTPQSFLREAGFAVDVVPNQGAGAAMQRIDAVRRLFPSILFNEETTKAGRDALGWYHEKRDETRGIGLGPDHDWSSHGADAFGLMAIFKNGMKTESDWGEPLRRNLKGIV